VNGSEFILRKIKAESAQLGLGPAVREKLGTPHLKVKPLRHPHELR